MLQLLELLELLLELLELLLELLELLLELLAGSPNCAGQMSIAFAIGRARGF